MSPTQAGALIKRARVLLRAKRITAYDLTVLDCLVWCCRAPGQARACVPYSKLARLTAFARPTVVQAVSRLVELGLLTKLRQRVRVGWASRCAANIYLFALAPDTEFTALPVLKGLGQQTKKKAPPFEGSALDMALKGLQARLSFRGSP